MSPFLGLIADLTRTHEELEAENAALRQQVIYLSRKGKVKSKLTTIDRIVLLLAAARTKTWRDAIFIVKPDTILRWHREGFRLLWRKKSRTDKRKPKISADVIALIKQMSEQNPTWGAERIRGELKKLGIDVAKRTVQRYMVRKHRPRDGQTWKTFLKNHSVWACDFLQVYDCWFRPIYAFFVVDENEKNVVHVAVTRSPHETWTAQQLREVTPFGEGPDAIIRDRDGKFGGTPERDGEFDRVAKGADIRVVKTPPRTPNMNRSGKVQLAAAFHGGPRPSEARGDEVAVNAVMERFLGSVRRECLDHILILNERHLEAVLKEYAFEYFNNARPHQGIGQRVPVPTEREKCQQGGNVVAFPVPCLVHRRDAAPARLGGLHHDYQVAA